MRLYIIDDDNEANDPLFKKNFNSIVSGFTNSGHKVVCEAYLEKAYYHLTDPSNRYKYDLILVDYLFHGDFQSGVFENGTEEINSKNGTGTFLCGELAKMNLPTPIILFTATGKDPDNIREVLGDYGICYFYEKNEFKTPPFEKIVTLPGFTRVHSIRENEIEKILTPYFTSLLPKDRNLYRSQPKWYLENGNFNINGVEYLLKDLLYGLEQERENKLLEYLDRTDDNYFEGDLANSRVDELVEKYLNDSRYELIKKEIDLEALNYLLNTLSVIKQHKDSNNNSIILNLNAANKRYKATISFKKYNLEELKTKLILRRVALGLDRLNMFLVSDDENLRSDEVKSTINYKIIIAALLRHGDTNIFKKNGDNITPTHTYKIGLGLKSNQGDRTNLSFNYKVLPEEEYWINHFTPACEDIRKFLDIAYSMELSNKSIEPEDIFSDLNEFGEFMNREKNKYRDLMKFNDRLTDFFENLENNTNELTSKLVIGYLEEKFQLNNNQ